MRPVLLSMLLVCGSATSTSAQQLKEITNSIGMKFVLVLPGTFTMGSPEDEEKRVASESQHLVTISQWYYLSAYEVIQDEFERVTGYNPSKFKGATNPVETVSWDEAVSFCQKLSELPEEKAVGREYRLPTEAEWEYACRAGSKNTYSFDEMSGSLKDYAWFGESLEDKSHPVGMKKPNRWGFYDMHGNVWEWCQDWHEAYHVDAATDPKGPLRGSFRVLRGGAWCFEAGYCRSASRIGAIPAGRKDPCGFRVAISLPVKQPEAASAK